ncbi:MAG: hypothetical protein JO362_23110 [Streptomycetaceae bacterium]|nr:hypothetical protein [Streptomycetaceae bacterium]
MTGPHHEDVGGELRTELTAGPGGAMTREVGVITGDVTLATVRLPDGRIQVRIQYTGAEEWYELDGSPLPPPPGGAAAVHTAAVEAVRGGGAATLT